MLQILEAITILLIVWQLMIRIRRNVNLSPNAKSDFKEAIDDAKNRLPRSGLFALVKGDSISSSSPRTNDHTKIQIEQTFLAATGDEKENLD